MRRQFKIYEKRFGKTPSDIVRDTIGYNTDMTTTISRTHGQVMTSSKSQTGLKNNG